MTRAETWATIEAVTKSQSNAVADLDKVPKLELARSLNQELDWNGRFKFGSDNASAHFFEIVANLCPGT